ncbi:MAG: ankyrin repeat domain-containing protein [Opitutus sp.]
MPTLYEKLNTRLQNHRAVAVLILIGSIVIGISAFTDAAKNLTVLFAKPDAEDARLKLAQLSVPYTADEFVERAGAGDLTLINLFLAAGMDPNVILYERGGPTALFLAARENHPEVVEALLKAGAKIINESSNAIEAAAQSGNVELLNRLLKTPVDRERLDEAFIVGKNRAILETLLAHGADLKKSGPEALLYSSDPAAVSFLLAHEVSFNTPDSAGHTFLQRMDFDTVNLDTLQTLIDRGADLEARDKQGRTLLTTFSGKGYRNAVERLIGKSVNLNAVDADGRTALSLACSLKHQNGTELVALLLKSGAEVNAADRAGKTPLSYARQLPNAEVVQLLLAHGAKE